jgi:hemolysin III
LFGARLVFTGDRGREAVMHELAEAERAAKRIPYSHAIWHLFVLAGSICHYFAVLSTVIPPRV